jgi:tRNA (mo5U34)-methyltransferase
MQIEIDRFFEETSQTFIAPHHPELARVAAEHTRIHGRTEEWDKVLAAISECTLSNFDADTIAFGDPTKDYIDALEALLPWRKGPLKIGQTFVDTEWRSDWKWQRVLPHISNLNDRAVLDIGCGNGYHLFRMLAAGAKLALGVDPTVLFNYQFALMQRLAADNAAYLLPLRSEHLPPFGSFDTVFSMGVLYHRRSPLAHIEELISFLRPGGELVLETLVVPGDSTTVLMPEDRYAKMANVWFIPSPELLRRMLSRLGLKAISIVDVTTTTIDEQRATDWMRFHSLSDFLDPEDSNKTIEGYPAPMRATIVATKPGA